MAEICKDLNKLHPKVKELAEKFLKECALAGLNIKISETYRSIARQDELYAQGRTTKGNIVTNAKGADMSSYHQWGLAFDIFNNVKGHEYDIGILTKAGAIGQKLGLEWGGSWKDFKDYPHFQYTFGLSIKDLKSNKKPPEYKPPVDEDYLSALNVLVNKKIVSSPELWKNLDNINKDHVRSLIIKVSKELNQ